MKILSVNVSEPKKVIFNGKELITSIYKKPVSKMVRVTSQGIEGDSQADLSVHGGYDKAVYGYSFNITKHGVSVCRENLLSLDWLVRILLLVILMKVR